MAQEEKKKVKQNIFLAHMQNPSQMFWQCFTIPPGHKKALWCKKNKITEMFFGQYLWTPCPQRFPEENFEKR